MPKHAFLDPATSRLKAHGFVATNEPGDLVLEVSDGFALDPRDGWRWDGSAFVGFPFPVPANVQAIQDATAAVQANKFPSHADIDAKFDAVTTIPQLITLTRRMAHILRDLAVAVNVDR